MQQALSHTYHVSWREDDPLSYEELADQEYAQMLDSIVRLKGIEMTALAKKAGMHRVTAYKILRGKEPTIKGLVSLYRALIEMVDVQIPPPAIPITSREDYRWARIGQRLRKANPERFRRLLERASQILDAEEGMTDEFGLPEESINDNV